MSFDASKGSVMLEFKIAAAKNPTVLEVKRQFKLADNEIDDAAGIIPMDGGKTFIAVISSEAGARIEKQKLPGFVKKWSNDNIGPF